MTADKTAPAGMRILERLRDEGRIDAAAYETVYHQAKRSGERVEDVILDAGILAEPDLLKLIAGFYKTRFVGTERLAKAGIERSTLELLPRRMAERLQCCPILHDRKTNTLSVVAYDLEEDVAKQVTVATGVRDVRVFVSRPAAVKAALKLFYGGDVGAFSKLMAPGAAAGTGGLSLDVFERSRPHLEAPPSRGRAIAELEIERSPASASVETRAIDPRTLEPAKSSDARPIAAELEPLLDVRVLEAFNVLVTLLEEGRAELRGHSSHVARICRDLAPRLNMSDEESRALALAGYVHDLGKASVYHLTALNVSRFEGHRGQALRAYEAPARILESARLPARSVEILSHMYERFDGQGFPDRLGGKDIPLGARALALVETYSDLTTNPKNPYRRTLEIAEGIDVLRQLGGTIFDPVVVDVLARVVIGDPLTGRDARSHVLLIDPDREEATVLELRLAEAGHKVTIAREREEALAALAGAKLDLVLCEIELAGGDGLDLVRDIVARAKDKPVVVLTRRADRDTVARAYEAGAVDFLVKPLSAEVVIAKTAKIIEDAASSRAPKRAGGLAGRLADMSLPDVIQALGNGRKTGALRVSSGRESGEIHLLDGQIVDATFGTRTKEDAIYAMLALSSGEFELDPGFKPTKRTINASAEALLLEGMRRLDEGLV